MKFNFLKNISFRTLIILSHQISMLLILLLVGNRLSTYMFAIGTSALVIFQIAYSITEWGFSIDSIKKLKNRSNNFKIKYFMLITNCKILLFVLIISILFIVFFINTENIFFSFPIIVFWTIVAIFFGAFNNLWFFQSINRTDILLIPTLVGRLFGLIIVFFYLNDDQDLYILMLAQSISFAFPAAAGYLYCLNNYKFSYNFSFIESFNKISETIKTFFTTVFQSQLHTLWAFIFILTGNPLQFVSFNLADQLIRSGNAFSTLIPEALIANSANNKINFKRIIFIMFCLLFITLLITLVIDRVISIAFDNKFNEALPILYLSLFSWLLISYNKILSFPIIGELKSHNVVNIISVTFFVIHLLSLFYILFFINYDVFSFAITFLILQIIQFLYLLFKIRLLL